MYFLEILSGKIDSLKAIHLKDTDENMNGYGNTIMKGYAEINRHFEYFNT